MPVRIGNVDVAGEHTAVADINLSGRTDPDPRADQAIVTYADGAFAFKRGPHGKPGSHIGCCDNMGIFAQFNGRTEDFNMPGFDKYGMIAKGFELRSKETVGVKSLKFHIRFFDKERPMVFYQTGTSLCCSDQNP